MHEQLFILYRIASPFDLKNARSSPEKRDRWGSGHYEVSPGDVTFCHQTTGHDEENQHT